MLCESLSIRQLISWSFVLAEVPSKAAVLGGATAGWLDPWVEWKERLALAIPIDDATGEDFIERASSMSQINRQKSFRTFSSPVQRYLGSVGQNDSVEQARVCLGKNSARNLDGIGRGPSWIARDEMERARETLGSGLAT